MAHLRLAIITSRFWPHIGDAATRLLTFAESLLAAGHEVTVVAPQTLRSWPQKMNIGRIPLVRLRGSARGGWSTLRWMYSLRQWLGEQSLDGVLVAGLKHEAYVTLGATMRGSAIKLLMAEEDDVLWQRTTTLGSRIANRCREARAIVTPSEELSRQLIGAGYARDALQIIGRRVNIPPARNPKLRDAARTALATANYDLATATSALVALAIGRLDTTERFGDLVRAWRIVTARKPEARLWIIGDGPLRDQLYRQVGDLDQRFRVFLPGSFDSHDELLQASDMLLCPSQHSAPSVALLQAQAAGLPVIAADEPAFRAAIKPDVTGILHPPGDMKAIAAAVLGLMNEPAKAVELGVAARAEAQLLPTTTEETLEYLALLERLLGG